jgi:hypothetical protein
MSDRIFIFVLIAWLLAVFFLCLPIPALFAQLKHRLRAQRNNRASAAEIKRQVQAAESGLGKGSSMSA